MTRNSKNKTRKTAPSAKPSQGTSQGTSQGSSTASGGSAFFTRRRALFAFGAAAVVGGGWLLFKPTPTMAEEVVVYKDPSCECCGRWARHMRQNGFAVTVYDVDDVEPIKRKAGIPEEMESCHTGYVGGYSIEGHIPASDIKRLLAERPAIKGLTVPGMPSSAPGMDSPEREPYTVVAFDAKGRTSVFARH